MSSLFSQFYIYVDIDDTLIRSFSTKRIPISRSIDYVKAMKKQGAILYCWSSGGAEYAQKIANELGIADIFSAFLPKPHIILDDQKVEEWRYLVQVHPMSISSDNIDFYKDMLINKNSSG